MMNIGQITSIIKYSIMPVILQTILKTKKQNMYCLQLNLFLISKMPVCSFYIDGRQKELFQTQRYHFLIQTHEGKSIAAKIPRRR